ncbi:mobile element protein [Geminocystis sp. NIES-3708]|uniref:RNA-guided endonuclease TnpB family protein n=1 Tax=Geminocystis sp. NIES-3708 TaxID=1615909 RepID=UPI0005FC4981|nr:RNA-guided endonuclease TnpB family protein [Geminocystis sp. NIES-3708]BAQ62282.1 mobile element protein [Geminocystis sp. NIES-3708]
MEVTRTIKLKFKNLNKCKADIFVEMTAESTRVANELLAIPYMERRNMTTAKVVSSLKSALLNQVIRHTCSATGRKAKHYNVLPPEINKQNWKLMKVGDTFSLSFPTVQGEKRVPVEVASRHWQYILDGILLGEISYGSFKLICHKNKWYAYVSITEDVPEVKAQKRLGVDRGQNQIAVVAGSKGFGKFYSGREVKHRRRYFQKRREELQKAKKFRALKKWNKKERRWMEAINHTVSCRIVRFAEYHQADVVIEDLESCRKTMKQRKKDRSNMGQSRHSWAFYSLEQKLDYKLSLKGLRMLKRPAPYTSKSCSKCGVLGNRKGHHFNCPNGHYSNSDLNASRNLAQYDGFSCQLDLKKADSVIDSVGLVDAVLGNPPNSMKQLPFGVNV